MSLIMNSNIKSYNGNIHENRIYSEDQESILMALNEMI
jgi:hypothetical protein